MKQKRRMLWLMKRLLAKLSLEPDPDPQYRKRFETTSQSLDSRVTAHSI
jgi:hypothetical protein